MKQIIVFAVLFVSHVVQCDDFGCKTSGFTCSDCETVIMCTDLYNGKWQIDELDKCNNADNLTCLNGACTTKTNPDCAIEVSVESVLGSGVLGGNGDGNGGEDVGIDLSLVSSSGRHSCETSGFACSGCGTVIMCTAVGPNQWQIQEVDTCRKEDKVSCINGACSNKTNLDCGIEPEVKFPCGTTGMFPDPFDCQTYHICCNQEELSIGHRCEKGYMYNPTTTYCSIRYPTTGCPSGLPTCQTRGQRGPVPGTRSMYYMCVTVLNVYRQPVLYPKMFVCPFGRPFEGNICI